MRRHRLFCPDLSEGAVVLPPEESHHAVASLRAKPGREVVLFDGFGGEGVGRIAQINGRQVRVDVAEVTRRPFELPHKVTLAVAMVKAHRQGYLIEKCTELGAAAIWPIIADRSVSKPTEAARKKWVRRAIEAAKQAERSWMPKIAPPQTFSQSVERIGEFDASSITHIDPSAKPFWTFLVSQADGSSILVWVGPEGGWSDDERGLALQAGATLTTLGPTVLRTETAAVAVCAAASMCGVMEDSASKSG